MAVLFGSKKTKKNIFLIIKVFDQVFKKNISIFN